MGTPQQQAATAIANLLGRVGRFAVIVGVGGGIAQTSLYTGDISAVLPSHTHPDHLSKVSKRLALKTRDTPNYHLCFGKRSFIALESGDTSILRKESRDASSSL